MSVVESATKKVTNEARRFSRKVKDDIAPDIMPKMPEAPAASLVEAPRPSIQVETRAQSLGARAAAASISRTENETDLLGLVAPRKRAGQARQLLG